MQGLQIKDSLHARSRLGCPLELDKPCEEVQKHYEGNCRSDVSEFLERLQICRDLLERNINGVIVLLDELKVCSLNIDH